MKYRVGTAAFVVLVSMIRGLSTPIHAQEAIRPADSAQILRRIWMTRGSVNPGNEEIGFGTGSVGDVNNDSIGDFAVRWGIDGRWRVYYGRDSAPDEQPAWISDPSTMLPPVVGDFWGSGRKAVGFPTAVWADSGHNTTLFRLPIYRTEHDSLAKVPDLTIAPDSAMLEHAAVAGDFDGDGIDDLALSKLDLRGWPGVWIYRGGVDFGTGSPTLLLHDQERVNPDMPYYTVVGDFDGDHRLDILTGGTYAAGQQLKFWFSSMHSSVWEWDQPDRVITLNESSYPSIYDGLHAGDLDGDKVLDLVFTSRDGVIRLYLSRSSGKHALDRSFKLDDADRTLESEATQGRFVGYMNDSERHYGMLGAVGTDSLSDGIFAVFGSGPNGPDARYEGYFNPQAEGLYDGVAFSDCTPVTDVTGDGWDDLLVGDWKWYDQILHPGIALILAGGPYIPRDISLGVREVAFQDHRDALSIWPIPAHDELHIAWRGDLSRMPARFEVRDVLGRLIAEGSAESWRGAVVWNCAAEPSGLYLLAVFDRTGDPIATATVRVAA